MTYRHLIRKTLEDSIDTKRQFISDHELLFEEAASMMVETFRQGGKIMICGNGGSAADAQHMAAEFVNRFQMERRPLAALALTTDCSILTSIGNDYSFDDIFSKQVQALGKKGDILICITTSGNSPNVIEAATTAKKMDISIIGLSGSGGRVKTMADIAFCVDSPVTARIQESHITAIHILCDLTERILFSKNSP